MKQTNNAIKFLMAQYRAIFKNANIAMVAASVMIVIVMVLVFYLFLMVAKIANVYDAAKHISIINIKSTMWYKRRLSLL